MHQNTTIDSHTYTKKLDLTDVKTSFCDHQKETLAGLQPMIKNKTDALAQKVDNIRPNIDMQTCIQEIGASQKYHEHISKAKKERNSLSGSHERARKAHKAKSSVNLLIRKLGNTEITEKLKKNKQIIDTLVKDLQKSAQNNKVQISSLSLSKQNEQEMRDMFNISASSKNIDIYTVEKYLHIHNLEGTIITYYETHQNEIQDIEQIKTLLAQDSEVGTTKEDIEEQKETIDLINDIRSYIKKAHQAYTQHETLANIHKTIDMIPGASQARETYEKKHTPPLSGRQNAHIHTSTPDILSTLLSTSKNTTPLSRNFYNTFPGITPQSLQIIALDTSTNQEHNNENNKDAQDIKNHITSRWRNYHTNLYITQNTQDAKNTFSGHIATAQAALPKHNPAESDPTKQLPGVSLSHVAYTSTGFTYILETPFGADDPQQSNSKPPRDPLTLSVTESDKGKIVLTQTLEDKRGQKKSGILANISLTQKDLAICTTQQKIMACCIEHTLPGQLYTNNQLDISESQKSCLTLLSDVTSQLSQANLNKLYTIITAPRFDTRLSHSKISISSQKQKTDRTESLSRLINQFLLGDTSNTTYTLDTSIDIASKQSHISSQLDAFVDLVQNPDETYAQADAKKYKLQEKHKVILENIEGKNGIYAFHSI